MSATLDGGLGFVLASVFAFSRRGRVWCAGLFAGIRVLLACFKRRPCAGRHLLFFAAAKKSRQKKAAHTASSCSCPRAPNGPTLHTATSLFACVANASNKRLTRFRHPHKSQRQRMVFATWVAHTIRCRSPVYGSSKRVRRSFEALATSTDQSTAV